MLYFIIAIIAVLATVMAILEIRHPSERKPHKPPVDRFPY
jgi:uncharacterized membrane protein